MDWFRMYGEFATDPKVQSMPEAMQRRLVMLLCLRCSNTLVTLHETDIAFALRIDDEALAETKALFVRKNFINEDWELVNWDDRQKPSDSSAARVAKHRAKAKQLQEQDGNVTETAQSREEEIRKEKKEPKSKASATATRLPADWVPDADQVEFCKTERPDLRPADVAARFRDYWIAVGGAKGRKADWPATWRNWVRNEKTIAQPRGSPGGYESIKDKSRRETIAALTGSDHERPEPTFIDIN
jgi:hypothetical protein